MRWLCNENIPRNLVEELRRLGHDAVSIRERSPGIADAEVLALAVRERRICLTFDKDSASWLPPQCCPRIAASCSCGFSLGPRSTPRRKSPLPSMRVPIGLAIFRYLSRGAEAPGQTEVQNNSDKRGLGVLGLDFRGERVRLAADLGYQYQYIGGLIPVIGLDANVALPPVSAAARTSG
jgi:hypothetical protein